MEQQVTGNAFTMVGVNRNNPAHMANPVAEPHDFIQPVRQVSSEFLLLLG